MNKDANDKNSSFDKLLQLQSLIKKESSLRVLCK